MWRTAALTTPGKVTVIVLMVIHCRHKGSHPHTHTHRQYLICGVVHGILLNTSRGLCLWLMFCTGHVPRMVLTISMCCRSILSFATSSIVLEA